MDGGCNKLSLLALCGSGSCLPDIIGYIVSVVCDDGVCFFGQESLNFRTGKLHIV